MPAEVGVRVGGHDAGLTTPPHTVSPPPSPPRLSIPHLICQLSALPDARFGGRDENCGLGTPPHPPSGPYHAWGKLSLVPSKASSVQGSYNGMQGPHALKFPCFSQR